jgi:hypothetical protein
MAKPAKRKALLSPFMLTLAAMTGWAAAHEPGIFTPASVGVWICGSFTVALLTRAALALFTPVLGMMGMIFSRAMKNMQRDGAES